MSKLYLLPEEGMISGVCAGIARYFDVPTVLVRIAAIIALFAGGFVITIVFYLILTFVLDSAPTDTAIKDRRNTGAFKGKLTLLEQEILGSEQRLRELERYVTSETFRVESRFHRL